MPYPRTIVKRRFTIRGRQDATGNIYNARTVRFRIKRKSTGLKKMVKTMINKAQETKYVTYCPVNNITHNSTITGGDYYRVLPHVFQGTTEYQRVGDKIKPVSLTVKGQVAINRDRIDSTRAIMVRIMILQLKQAHNYFSSSQAWSAGAWQSLLKQNDESGVENIPFSGNANEQYLPVNRDMFDVLGERFVKLTQIAGVPTAIEAPPVNAIAKNFNIRIKKLPAHLIFTAGGQNEPTQYAPFMCFAYSYMDGSSPDTGAFTGLVVNAQSHLYFKDA